jgi:hypothetical protein
MFFSTQWKLTSGRNAHLNYYNFSEVSTVTRNYKIEGKWLMEKKDCLPRLSTRKKKNSSSDAPFRVWPPATIDA